MSSFPLLSSLAFWLGSLLTLAAAGYACAILGALLWSRRSAHIRWPAQAQPVTVLKPLHLAEAHLYENLRSFCMQTYPRYQLVFGVREADDPAIAIVEQLRQEFPQLAIELVIDARVHGSNLKVSNLLNMLPKAQHTWLVLADSDISVLPNYLATVTAPLAHPTIGIVTCLYYGMPQANFWSRLGCLFIDDWFAPSVRLSHVFGSTRFAFGSTIALRRDTLEQIGGFAVLNNVLADDFWLGELTRQAGLRTVLSSEMVGTEVTETRFAELWNHELRWLRTIRSIAPAGFAMSFVCFTWPVCLLGLVLAPSLVNLGLALLAIGARVALFFSSRSVRRLGTPWQELLWSPLRDALLLLEWAVALTSWRVRWRGQELQARQDGPTPSP